MNREPAPDSFEEYLWTYEVDYLGAEGLATQADRDRLYEEWRKLPSQKARSDGAKTAAKTRAKNAAKGISQKNLTGSTKQKQWAADIRGKMIGGFSEENRAFLMDNRIHSSFWINYRDVPASVISEAMDKIYGEMTEAIRARDEYAAAHSTPQGVLITHEYSLLRESVTAKKARWHKLLDGEDDPKGWR